MSAHGRLQINEHALKQTAVLIRLDKIGDLVSTIPVDEHELLKDYEISWVISKGMGFIAEQALPQRKYLELNAKSKLISLIKLIQFLKLKKPSLAISFQAPWWVTFALWFTGIPVRAGTKSQWHSFLFLNRGLRQKRSQATQHESSYNLDLLFYAFEKQNSKPELAAKLKLQASVEIKISKWDLSTKKYFVVHPGMAGSALNWKIQNYIDLIKQLKNQSPVVITGTLADESWLTEIKKEFQLNPQVKILQNKLTSLELLSVLKEARAVIAPSTGVLHLAAALGTKSIGIYSPVQVQNQIRWKARGDLVTIFAPSIQCPAQFYCLETKCKDFYCLDQVKVETVLKESLGT